MRVVAGVAKGRRLAAPKGRGTRPTSDRVREAIFAMVASRVDLEGTTVADLFAGSGAMGIEALSRGAGHATFVDESEEAVRTIRANLRALDLEAAVVRADVIGHLQRRPQRFGVAFVDPPYAWDGWNDLFGCLDAALVVAESDRSLAPGDRWRVLKERRHGDTVVTLAEHAAAGDEPKGCAV
jgi:16S rRNA (guanine966-N2)-methyltransferase